MNLTEIGAYATAIISIAALLSLLYKGYRTCCKIYESFMRIEHHQKETYIMCLKLIIMSEEMPLSERIEAGDIYVSRLNKNGAVKKKYTQLIEQYGKETI